MNKERIYLIIVLLVISLASIQVSAEWYSGHLHQHTGYSTDHGYDRNPDTADDDCRPRLLEGHDDGRTVEILAGQAILEGMGWFGLSDHSYCINTTEFNRVDQDCDVADVPLGFTCLMGEELSVSDNSFDNEFLLPYCSNPINYGEAHEGAYGLNTFIAQSPEARHCPETPTGQEGINQINTQGGLSILNHPHPNEASFIDFESVFDMSGYNGIEIWNGVWNDEGVLDDDTDNFDTWRTILLRGDHVYAYGGSDSHNDILPVGTGNENYVSINGALTQTNLRNALKNGTVSVSNNGLAFLEVQGEHQNHWTMQGNTTRICSGEDVTFRLNYSDVTNACNPMVYVGRITTPAQSSEDPDGIDLGPDISGTAPAVLTTIDTDYGVSQDIYYRAECIGGDSRIYTNPVWVEIDNTFSDADSVCDTSDCRPYNRYVFPGNANTNCDCDASDGIDAGTTEVIGDGVDNDCDGAIDEGTVDSDPACINGATRLCPSQFGVCSGAIQTCSGGDWPSCDYASWSANYQTVETFCDALDNDCDALVDEARGCRPECATDETLVACTIRPLINSLAQIYYDFDLDDARAWNLPSDELGLILGETGGGGIRWWVPERFDITGSRSTCPSDVMDYLNGAMERNQARLLWRNSGPNSCDNSRIYRNLFNEALLAAAATNEATLGTVSNWEYIHSINAACDANSDVEETIEADLDDDFVNYGRSDEIALAFWPNPGQNSWTIDEVGNDVSLELDICRPCIDADGDGFNSDTSCGTSNDCRDSGTNAVNIFPGNANTFCDCASPFPQGRTETCDGFDDDCDGIVDEGCDDDADGSFDITIAGGDDCDDANADVRPGLAEDCRDGLDNDCDGFTDCADAECTQGSASASGFCCGSGCSTDSGTCLDASITGITCTDGNCTSYSEACQNGELESSLACSGTALSCSDGSCEVDFGAPTGCDEITPGDVACENSAGVNEERACEVSGTDCYVEAELSCSSPSGCDELAQDACSTNSGLQCEWQGSSNDNVVEECESTSCGAISQCDEQLPGYNLTSCTLVGQTYFAEDCSSSCQGQDRPDNICRSSAFAADCTAHTACDGFESGTNQCNSTCEYTPCGVITQDLTLRGNMNAQGTCFTIGASNIMIDGGGYIVTGDNTGYGVLNNEGHDNIIIRNIQLINFTNGIYLVNSESNTILNNTIETFNSSSYRDAINLTRVNSSRFINNTLRAFAEASFALRAQQSDYNDFSFNTILANGSFGMGMTIFNSTSNNITSNHVNTSGAQGYGIRLYQSTNTRASGNNVITRGDAAFAVYLVTSANNNVILSNTINTSEPNGYGIFIEMSSINNNLSNNTIETTGTLSRGIVTNTAANNTIIEVNNITTTGTRAEGIYFSIAYPKNITISSNVIYTSGPTAHGIRLENTNESFISSNRVNVIGTDAHGILIEGSTDRNTFLNNNLTAEGEEIRDNTLDDYFNYLVYNNSFGEIRWLNNGTGSLLRNLTFDVNNSAGIGLERNLFIGDNVASLNTTAFFSRLINSSADIILNGLPYASINQIVKDQEYRTNSVDIVGFNCLGSSCQQISYAGGILRFNTTSFSSFRADGT